MKSKLQRAYDYMVGYCMKQANCERCRFFDEDSGECALTPVPANWPVMKAPKPIRVFGFLREENNE